MRYIDYLRNISDAELYEGLLGYGLFNLKLPPFLTSVEFYNYCLTHTLPNFKSHDWIRFDNNRNNGLPRTLGIPNPFNYSALCGCLRDNWQSILTYFDTITTSQDFKISRIHVRKLDGTKAIFEMNYEKYKEDGSPEPPDIIKSRYIVKTDISQCFGSIYTHSIPWAILGKALSKTMTTPTSHYSNMIDLLTRNTTFSETHGILIGPVSSNIISEIILCKVDEALHQKGFAFVRHIDDYKCYVSTVDEGEQFLNLLRENLAFYDLSINEKKTEILSLSSYRDTDLKERIHQLDYLLNYQPGLPVITYPQLRSYLDAITKLYLDLDNNASVYTFAYKLLNKYDLSMNASCYLINKAMNLAIIHPYLLPFMAEHIFGKYGVTSNTKTFCETLYDEGIKNNNFEKCVYGMYFGIICNVDFSSDAGLTIKDNAMKFDDCFLRLVSWLYCEKFYPTIYSSDFYQLALTMNDTTTAEFNRNWIFAYEVLDRIDLKGNEWKAIKKANVSFIDKTKLMHHTHWRTVFYS